MAIDTTQWAADLNAMIADLPGTMTAAWLSTATAVSLAELSAEVTLILTGRENKKAFACTLPISATSSVPKAEDRVQITGQGESVPTNYQVLRVTRSADGVAYTLFLLQDVRKPA